MTSIENEYRSRYNKALLPIAGKLQQHLEDILSGVQRVDRISVRAKSVDRFVAKANTLIDGGIAKYEQPLHQIQDQIGARIVTFYRSDVDRIGDEILRYFRPIESRDVVPQREWEFGYFGQHHILLLPADVVDETVGKEFVPWCFELQIKTLFQHAWSEANHDLGYKPGQQVWTSDDLRQLAFTSAQAWGADRIFGELFERMQAART